VGRSLKQPVFAGAGKLPASLAGINVTLAGTNISAVLEVNPGVVCNDCTGPTAITIQIPYELQPAPTNGPGGVTAFYVTENGVSGTATPVLVLSDQVHILTVCDTVIGASGQPTSGRCQWEITHQDGSLVSMVNPASEGEVLTAYAVGLGATNPAVPTGQPVAQATPATQTFRMGFDFEANASPSGPPSTAPAPLYAGLTPGYPGLYQINFVVPSIPAGLPPCNSYQGTKFISTNLTVSVAGQNSFDGAELCVSVPK
jgi:uncharacterized protein (TIGR03437 family)